MSTFVKSTNTYSITPSSYIGNIDFVNLACRQGVKTAFLKYAPLLKISRQHINSLRFGYYDDAGRELAVTFNRPPLMRIPSTIAHIFISAGPVLVGAWTTNQKPVGMHVLASISETLDIPLPTTAVAHARLSFATLILRQVETACGVGGSGKVCFFYNDAQGHITETGLPGVALCTLHKAAIQRIPTTKGNKPETLAWFWLEYLLQNKGITSEEVDSRVKNALTNNDTWLTKALKIIKG